MEILLANLVRTKFVCYPGRGEGDYHVYRGGMCHFLGCLFQAKNKFEGVILVRKQIDTNFGVSF